MQDERKPAVAVVYYPWPSDAPYQFLSDVLAILDPITERIVLIGGNTHKINSPLDTRIRDIGVGLHHLRDRRPTWYSGALWVVKCIQVQIFESLELIRSRQSITHVIFYMAYPYYLLPLLVSTMLGKTTIEVVTRSKTTTIQKKLVKLQDPLLFSLLTGISPETKNLLSDLQLIRYPEKIRAEGARFIDDRLFHVIVPFNQRERAVGFFGRLREEKGIMEFLEAAKILAKKGNGIHFIVVGDGNLRGEVEQFIAENRLADIVEYRGWCPHEEISRRLNELKLLVLPSYSEGLPTILLEAMSCGTPILATPVGGIPDLLSEAKTGFFLHDVSPESIVSGIEVALNDPNLEGISRNAQKLIADTYTLEGAVKRWSQILEN